MESDSKNFNYKQVVDSYIDVITQEDIDLEGPQILFDYKFSEIWEQCEKRTSKDQLNLVIAYIQNKLFNVLYEEYDNPIYFDKNQIQSDFKCAFDKVKLIDREIYKEIEFSDILSEIFYQKYLGRNIKEGIEDLLMKMVFNFFFEQVKFEVKKEVKEKIQKGLIDMLEHFKTQGTYGKQLQNPEFRLLTMRLDFIAQSLLKGEFKTFLMPEPSQFIANFIQLACFLGCKTSVQGQKENYKTDFFGYNAKIRVILESFEKAYKPLCSIYNEFSLCQILQTSLEEFQRFICTEKLVISKKQSDLVSELSRIIGMLKLNPLNEIKSRHLVIIVHDYCEQDIDFKNYYKDIIDKFDNSEVIIANWCGKSQLKIFQNILKREIDKDIGKGKDRFLNDILSSPGKFFYDVGNWSLNLFSLNSAYYTALGEFCSQLQKIKTNARLSGLLLGNLIDCNYRYKKSISLIGFGFGSLLIQNCLRHLANTKCTETIMNVAFIHGMFSTHAQDYQTSDEFTNSFNNIYGKFYNIYSKKYKDLSQYFIDFPQTRFVAHKKLKLLNLMSDFQSHKIKFVDNQEKEQKGELFDLKDLPQESKEQFNQSLKEMSQLQSKVVNVQINLEGILADFGMQNKEKYIRDVSDIIKSDF